MRAAYTLNGYIKNGPKNVQKGSGHTIAPSPFSPSRTVNVYRRHLFFFLCWLFRFSLGCLLRSLTLTQIIHGIDEREDERGTVGAVENALFVPPS